MLNQTQYDKQAQLLLENDLKQQLGLLGGEKGGLIGPGGLSIIQDENDSNQDSDFSGDNEEPKATDPAVPDSDMIDLMPGVPIPDNQT